MQPLVRVLQVVAVAGLLAAAASLPAAAQAEAPASRNELLQQGEQLLAQKQYRRALAAFEEAVRPAEGVCPECLLGVARAQSGLGKPERAAEAARAAIPLAPAGPLQVRAYHQLGVALSTPSGRSAEQLAEAEAAYRKVLELAGPDWNVERFNLAGLLFVVGRPAEAASLAREYLRNAANGVAGLEARMLICFYRVKGGARDAADAGTAGSDGDLTPPQALFRQPAIYSASARRAGLQGLVAVQVTVDRDGCVAQPTLMKGMGNELDAAAVETARRWVFTPAILGARPVSSDYIVSVTFAADADAGKDPDKVFRDRVLASWPVQ